MSGPVFFLKVGNKHAERAQPLFPDNVPRHPTSRTPEWSKEHEVLAPQPDGSYLRCYLQVRQCQGITEGKLCERSTVYQPYCAEHLRDLLHLEVRPSNIKAAGFGLFACRPPARPVPSSGEGSEPMVLPPPPRLHAAEPLLQERRREWRAQRDGKTSAARRKNQKKKQRQREKKRLEQKGTDEGAAPMEEEPGEEKKEPTASSSSSAPLPTSTAEKPISAEEWTRTPVFRKGEFVYWYHGEVMDRKKYRARYFSHLDPTDKYWFTPYALLMKDGRICDSICVRGILGMINDPRNLNRCNVSLSHHQWNAEGHRNAPACYATRDIYEGDELFTSYGDAWWGSFPDKRLAKIQQVPLNREGLKELLEAGSDTEGEDVLDLTEDD